MRMLAQAAGHGAANVTANVTTAQIFPDSVTPTVAYVLPLPGTKRYEQRRFTVRASGYITTGTTTNVTLTLYSGTSLTAGSNTVLKASSARAQNSVSAPFSLEAQLILDTVSGKLHGTCDFIVNNLYDVRAALANVVTSVNSATEPTLNFVVGVTFSANDVGNLGHLYEFGCGF